MAARWAHRGRRDRFGPSKRDKEISHKTHHQTQILGIRVSANHLPIVLGNDSVHFFDQKCKESVLFVLRQEAAEGDSFIASVTKKKKKLSNLRQNIFDKSKVRVLVDKRVKGVRFFLQINASAHRTREECFRTFQSELIRRERDVQTLRTMPDNLLRLQSLRPNMHGNQLGGCRRLLFLVFSFRKDLRTGFGAFVCVVGKVFKRQNFFRAHFHRKITRVKLS